MATQKLYAGVKLREVRQKRGLTQKTFAEKLGISLSYLNQMENNHRPISATVVLAMAQEFGFDVTELSVAEADRMVVDMREALADPLFGDPPPLEDLQLTASNAPALARAFLNLHRAHRHAQDRLASLNEALGHESTTLDPQPWEEVRDFFHYCDNYIDAVDRAAESFASRTGLGNGTHIALLERHLSRQHGIELRFQKTTLRQFENNILGIRADAPKSTQAFQIAHQIALIEHEVLLESTLDFAKFVTPQARAICKIGLANYFAGAALLPYGLFLAAAQSLRHDLDLLAERFGASIEQVAHRLSTLQRAGAKGVPFFFVRVDQAGTITKRHSATRLQFARFGGACPLWNVHRAFETPTRYLRQLAETPDGRQYFCLAKDITKPGGAYGAPKPRFAIGLGCEVSHAKSLVYADDFDLENSAAFEPIGISCRICERKTCHQRAVPPLAKPLHINPMQRGTLPYEIG
ncbi:MAG: short-chain fatty acyl-CoA regulator family protein [Rhodobacteraceae bacterium]|nr:short-chain fatty acyl-CoA regulator family protein [Paracoccaceae bacterium]